MIKWHNLFSRFFLGCFVLSLRKTRKNIYQMEILTAFFLTTLWNKHCEIYSCNALTKLFVDFMTDLADALTKNWNKNCSGRLTSVTVRYQLNRLFEIFLFSASSTEKIKAGSFLYFRRIILHILIESSHFQNDTGQSILDATRRATSEAIRERKQCVKLFFFEPFLFFNLIQVRKTSMRTLCG